MPVVQVVELSVDAVVILEASAVRQLGFKAQLQLILAQVLHVILNGDLDDLTYRKHINEE